MIGASCLTFTANNKENEEMDEYKVLGKGRKYNKKMINNNYFLSSAEELVASALHLIEYGDIQDFYNVVLIFPAESGVNRNASSKLIAAPDFDSKHCLAVLQYSADEFHEIAWCRFIESKPSIEVLELAIQTFPHPYAQKAKKHFR